MPSFLKSIIAGSIAVFAMTLGVAAPAQAKQCVWNKSGFLLNVKWYEPAEFQKFKRNKNYRPHPVQVDQFPLASGRCTRGRNAHRRLTAVLSAVGRKTMIKVTKFTIQGAAGLGTVVACAGTVGTGCAAAAVTAPAAAAILSEAIPNAGDVFWVGTPSTSRYLDVWGTIWGPVAKNVGGPIR